MTTAAIRISSKEQSTNTRTGRALRSTTALVGVALALTAAPWTGEARAQVVWQGDTDDNFNDGTNWVGDAVPNNTEIAVFNNTGTSLTPSVTSTVHVNGLEFANGAPSYLLSVNFGGLQINASGIVNNSVATQTINVNAGHFLQIAAGAPISAMNITTDGDIWFDGASNASSATIVNNNFVGLQGFPGPATVSVGSLSGNGNITFDTNIGQTLELGALNQFDTISGNISDGTGSGALEKVGTGTLTLSGANTYTGGTTITGGTLQIGDGGATGSITGDVVNNAALVVDRTGALTLAGDITGTGSLTKEGAGTLTLTGLIDLDGGVTVNDGILALDGIDAASSFGGITVDEGTLSLAGDNSFTSGLTITTTGSVIDYADSFDNLATIDLDSDDTQLQVLAGTATQSGQITETTGPHGFEKIGGGTLTLTNTTNTYAGATVLTDGTLQLGASEVIPDASDLTINGGTLDLNNFDETVANLSGTGGNIDTGGASGGLIVNQTVDGTYDGDFSGATSLFNSALTKDGGATLTLTGDNSQTGGGRVFVSGGRLRVQDGNAIGNKQHVVMDTAGASFELLSDETVGLVSSDAGTSILLTGGTLTIAGDGSGFVATSITNDGVFSGGGGVTVNAGNDTIRFEAANDYTGVTEVEGGTLDLNDGGSIDSTVVDISGGMLQTDGGGFTATNTAVTMTGGTLDISGSENLGTGGSLELNTAGATVTISGVGAILSAGTITTVAGSTINVGAGATLAGLDNTTNNGGLVEVLDGGAATDAGAINNLATGEYRFLGAGVLDSDTDNDNDGPVTNNGQINLQGTNAQVVQVGPLGNNDLINQGDGEINVNSGHLQVDGALTNSSNGGAGGGTSGVDINAGGILNVAGALTNSLGGVIDNAGTLNSNGGQIDNDAGATLTSTGVVTGGAVNEGVINAAGTFSGGIVNQGAGDFNVTGSLAGNSTFDNNDTATLDVTGGNFTGITTLTNNSTAAVGITVAAGQTLGATTLDNNAGATITSAGIIDGDVQNAGILNASGSITGNLVNESGGTLNIGTGTGIPTLEVNGNLALNAGSTTNFDLGQAGVVGGSGNDFVDVDGTLTLDGEIDIAGSATSGYYTLFNAENGATDNGVTVDTGDELYITMPAVGGAQRVNLLVANGDQTVQFWDGDDYLGGVTGAEGGAGTWNGADTNWTDIPSNVATGPGDINDSWRGGVAVFDNIGGAVTVAGTIEFEGLQFRVDNYELSGGTLEMTGDSALDPDNSFIRVDTGTANIASVLDDGAATIGLHKTGAGTLVLSGINTYDGETTVSDGMLQILAGGSITSNVISNAIFNNAGTVTGNVDNNATASNSGAIIAGVDNSDDFDNTGIVDGGLINTGIYKQTGGTSETNDGTTNTATINANGGAFNGLIANNAGGMFVVGGTVTSDDGFDNADGATLSVDGDYSIALDLDNAGAVNVAGGGVLNVGGDFNNAATGIVINDGTVIDDLNNAGAVTNNSSWTGDVATNTGTITNAGGATWIGNATNTGGDIINAGTWTTVGTAFMNDAGTLTSTGTLDGGLTNSAIANLEGTLNGTVQNEGGAEFNLTGDLSGVMDFTNQGDFFSDMSRSFGSAGSTFTNAATGVISLQNGTVGDTLTVNSDFTGMDGSQLNVDINLAVEDNSTQQLSDQLIVNGDFTGDLLVNFNVTDGFVNQDNDIVVIDLDPANLNDATVDFSGLPAGGIILYSFEQNPAEDWVVISELNLAAAGGVAGNISLVQSILGTVVNRPSSPFVSGLVAPEPNEPGQGIWMRTVGGWASGSSTVSNLTVPGAVPHTAEVDLDYAGIQLGADLGRYNINDTGLEVVAGVTGGYNYGRTSQTVPAISGPASLTEADFHSRFAGVYVSMFKAPFFADLQARVDVTDFSFENPTIGLNSAETDSIRYSLLGSAGYRFEVGDLAVIPSGGFSISHTDTSEVSFTGTNPGTLTPDSYNSYVGYVGGTIAKTIIMADEVSAMTPFVTGTVYHDFGDHPISRFEETGGGSATTIQTENIGTFGEISLGVNYIRLFEGEGVRQLNASIRGDFKFSDRVQAAGVSAQLRLQF